MNNGRLAASARARALAMRSHCCDREERGFAGTTVLEVDADCAAIDDVTDRSGDRVGLGTLPGFDVGGHRNAGGGRHRRDRVAHLRPRDLLPIRVAVCVRDREAAGADGRRARGREDARGERVPGVDQPQWCRGCVQCVEACGPLGLDVGGEDRHEGGTFLACNGQHTSVRSSSGSDVSNSDTR